MEKWKLLIKKVQEQAEADMDPARLLVTVQLLEEELVRVTEGEPLIHEGASVTILLPGARRKPDLAGSAEALLNAGGGSDTPGVGACSELPANAAVAALPGNTAVGGLQENAVVGGLQDNTAVSGLQDNAAGNGLPENATGGGPAEGDSASPPVPEIVSSPEREENNTAEEPAFHHDVWRLDPILETPTLAHQDEIKELNELMGRLNGESLNDRLKLSIERDEISSFLTETPVKDLKKAIGINDRFVFVNELFRGDEDMYERSLKTINNFRMLAEAEYWIERELKIKLGWDVDSRAARDFYKLVKRRFS